jgi:hypothetical protein
MLTLRALREIGRGLTLHASLLYAKRDWELRFLGNGPATDVDFLDEDQHLLDHRHFLHHRDDGGVSFEPDSRHFGQANIARYAFDLKLIAHELFGDDFLMFLDVDMNANARAFDLPLVDRQPFLDQGNGGNFLGVFAATGEGESRSVIAVGHYANSSAYKQNFHNLHGHPAVPIVSGA